MIKKLCGLAFVGLVMIGVGNWTGPNHVPPADEHLGIDDDMFFPEAAEKTFGHVTVSVVNSVHDGDTFTVTIKDWPPVAGEKVSVRLYGIDTPEVSDKVIEVRDFAKAARDHLKKMLTTAKKVELRNLRRDKYFRLNADVVADGKDVREALINAKFGRAYDGGTKRPWTVEDVRAAKKR